MVYLGREVTSHQHALDARARAPSSPRSATTLWSARQASTDDSSHFTELYFSLYKRGHWAVLSANTRSHLLQLIIEFGMGISHMGGHGSAVVSQPVRCGWCQGCGARVGHGGMRLASRQHQKYLSDLVVRFSTSLALFTEKPRNIVRKLKAPFRPILPEN